MGRNESRGTVVVVGSPTPAICRAVERRGLRVFALGFATGNVIPEDPVIVAQETIDGSSTLVVVRRLVELHASHGVRAIVPVGEFGLLPSAVAAVKLGLPGPSLAGVTATRDKLRMRRALDRAGLSQPRWAGCDNVAEAAAFLSSVDGPIVVKPAWGSGSEAISRVAEPGELDEAFERILASRTAGPVLCEQFVEGPEVSLEACTVEGRFVPIALTDKLTGKDFVETGHQQPSIHPLELQREVFATAGKALGALRLDQTVSHTELRLSATGPMLIETHTRMGGGRLHELTLETTGVDLADVTVDLALGERPLVNPVATGRGCAVRFLTGGPGRIESIVVPGGAGPGAPSIEWDVEVGSVVGECRSSFERLGSVVAVAASAEAAALAAKGHLERIEIGWREESNERKASLGGSR